MRSCVHFREKMESRFPEQCEKMIYLSTKTEENSGKYKEGNEHFFNVFR